MAATYPGPYGYMPPAAMSPSYQGPYGPTRYGQPVVQSSTSNYAPPRPAVAAPYNPDNRQTSPEPAVTTEVIAPPSGLNPPVVEGGADLEPVPVQSNTKNPPAVLNVQPPAQSAPAPAPETHPPAADAHAPVIVDDAFCPGGKCNKCSWFLFGDFLYLTVRGADVPYAQAFDGVTPLAVPRGPVAVADPDYHPAFRVGGGVAVGEGRWIQTAFTYFQSDTRDQITALPGTAIRSYVVFPATLNAAATSLEANARYDIDLYMVDADYKACLYNSPRCSVNYLIGARYAHLEESFRSTFDILGPTDVNSHITFDGAGPRAGLEGEFRGRGGLFGYGKGVINLLAGHFSADYVQANVFTGLQAQTEVGDDRLVPVLELEVGAGWMSPSGRVRLSGGYYVGSWFNTLTTNSLVRSVQASNFTTNGDNFRDTISFDGFVGRVEFRY
jgi:hypothetical protein